MFCEVDLAQPLGPDLLPESVLIEWAGLAPLTDMVLTRWAPYPASTAAVGRRYTVSPSLCAVATRRARRNASGWVRSRSASVATGQAEIAASDRQARPCGAGMSMA
jgi:hypothetical protein